MTKTKFFPQLETFDPSAELVEKARAILQGYHPIVEKQGKEYFGRFKEIIGVLASADSHDECMQCLLFLGETYIASAIIDEVTLPKPAQD